MDYQTFGFMDTASRTPLRDDAIFRIYSNTKIVTSVFLMMLYEEGLFDLDDPLAKFLPEFADPRASIANAATATDTKPAEHLISIRQLLSTMPV